MDSKPSRLSIIFAKRQLVRSFVTYRTSSLLFGAVIIILSTICWLTQISWWWLTVPVLLYIGLLVYGSINVRASFFAPVFCQGRNSKRQIALTFDDGPVAGKTEYVLDVLNKHSVKGTFFCIGNRLAANRSIGEQIHQEGHQLGNHSHYHGFWFDLLPANKMERELQQTDKEIASIKGEEPEWFRPPYGVTNPALANAVQRTGHKMAGWTIRTMDTVNKEPEVIADKVKRQLEPGSVILLHDSQEVVPQVLEKLIPFIEQQGYEMVRFDELMET